MRIKFFISVMIVIMASLSVACKKNALWKGIA